MWTRLKNLFGRTNAPIADHVENEVLGRLEYSADEEAWGTVPARGLPFRIWISAADELLEGEVRPAPASVAQAEALGRNPAAFLGRVAAFILRQAETDKRLSAYRDELSALEVSDVSLQWASRPGDGLIQFRGPHADRSWRCALINNEPSSPLGFDT
jgi:hypothetical protein